MKHFCAAKFHVAITLAAGFVASASVPSYAQIAPADDKAADVKATPVLAPAQDMMKPGWVAEITSANNIGRVTIGDVALASFILPANRADVYSYVAKRHLPAGFYAITLRGSLNVSETGKYGFGIQFDNLKQGSCGFNLSVDEQPVFTHEYNTNSSIVNHAEGSVELTAGMHPASLQLVCMAGNGLNYIDYNKLSASLRVKAPSDDELAPIAADFLIHKARKNGD